MLKDRLKLVRTSLPGNITQKQFAQMMGTTRPVITNYERGVITPKEVFLKLVCKEFQISEDWLLYGIGDMHVHNENNCLDEIMAISTLPNDCQTLIDYYLSMEATSQKILLSIAKELKNNDLPRLYLSCRAPGLKESDREDILKKMQSLEAKLIAEKESNHIK
ncbi:helix-turn-helix domain-containing protein [Selenomonas ruminis]|uniref:Helix-turn-helix domain-containing protein n=1 Tax=Selenomonas ruminis TaxID=2593411 RepID=A0A5D6W0D3_9FIRM|nr:helix-turn-helix transcriptional regulator [Selenomonas sp. mPRGC5]TYZ20208.1 helix-turn-helix domain-containing protein [Selenomonas sp. mPRGC5]